MERKQPNKLFKKKKPKTKHGEELTHREQWRLYIENSLQLMELPDKVKVNLASISSSFFRIAECSVTLSQLSYRIEMLLRKTSD